MRSSVWVVLGLVGLAPAGALAAQRSGQASRAPDQPSATNVEIFQGTLRAVEGDRLRMADANGNVYEFGLGQQARIIGPDGEDLARQGLREGTPVRTVTQPGDMENEVVTLQVFTPPESPSR